MKTILKLSMFFTFILVVACGSDDDASCVEQTWYQDADGDAYGNTSVIQNACTQPVGYVLDNTDCDDNNNSNNPGAIEILDGIDNDCDGFTDECVADSDCGAGEVCINGICEVVTTYYADVDNDGFGDQNNTTQAGNNPPNGYVLDSTDCNDLDTSINPNATEIPDNSIDEDCNASKDYTFYADNDGDGYGDASNSMVASCPEPCNNENEMTIPNGYVFNNLDCNDADASVNPFSTENTSDTIDNTCNGNTDIVYYYQDNDGDGFGDANDSGTSVNFAGSSMNNTDCDDSNSNIFFGASEIADGIDNNCNGIVDEF
ncbi:putative metal-binding motif-containing protein [Lacinutrix sp. Bg11-31]|uniref:putative metal-binding motif-containing protein n=1 Tax=Lacinutrix sp. Bg11-31 TaxID=2057808 RepID=UPI000C30710C|nr:putative metal-binding motif-containing protein [Lacinutrix sp. Bg11-31]AUC81849.1 hypothetical protein CW733_06765 [Lacinutrix sp. Bg11-31]